MTDASHFFVLSFSLSNVLVHVFCPDLEQCLLRTNINPPFHTPRVAAGRRRRRRPFQAKVAFWAGLIRPRNAGHVTDPPRGTHPGNRHAFIRAMETHRTAQARASPAVWLICPERAQGKVLVRVPGAKGPLVVDKERWETATKRAEIGHFAGSIYICASPVGLYFPKRRTID